MLRASQRIFQACGIWLVVLGLYFIFVRPPLLPEDLRFLGVSDDEMQKNIPRLFQWLHYVFIVMGGFIASSGILMYAMATLIVRQGVKGINFVFGVTGLLTVGMMSWINFLLDSQFKWLLLIPAILWTTGLVIYNIGNKSSRANDS